MFPKKIDSIKLKLGKLGLITVGIYILSLLLLYFNANFFFPYSYFILTLISGVLTSVVINETLLGRILYGILGILLSLFFDFLTFVVMATAAGMILAGLGLH